MASAYELQWQTRATFSPAIVAQQCNSPQLGTLGQRFTTHTAVCPPAPTLRSLCVLGLYLQGLVISQTHAAGVAAACSGVQMLSLHFLAVEDAALFTAIAPACAQLAHLVLEGVVLCDAAEESVGQLATGLQALQQLKVRKTAGAASAQHPHLLLRITQITQITCDWTSGWEELLEQHAPSFVRLGTLERGMLTYKTFKVLRACPSLTHIEVERIMSR